MAVVIDAHQAKAHISKLLERVRQGEEIVIAEGGKPVARVVPVTDHAVQRTPGSACGKITVGDDFDAPLSGDLLDDFTK